VKKKRSILAYLIILLSGVMYISVQAQQKNAPHRANFSGQWQAKEAISIGGNIFCSYDAGDRMASKSMKIVERGDFLTIENPASNKTSVKNLEKMVFDGKTRQISLSKENRKAYSVNLSNGGQTITINSIVYFITGTPYKVSVKQPAYTDVTEVWNLSNDGKSIAVLAKAKSNIWREERSWKTVFDRID
jgi:hypothetical protein